MQPPRVRRNSPSARDLLAYIAFVAASSAVGTSVLWHRPITVLVCNILSGMLVSGLLALLVIPDARSARITLFSGGSPSVGHDVYVADALLASAFVTWTVGLLISFRLHV